MRGAAWSIPVVAVAAQVPAFAASTDPPSPGPVVMACRTVGNGQGNCHGFRVTLTFQLQGPYTWNVSIAPSQITFDGGSGVATEIKTPAFPYQIGPGQTTMRLWFCTGSSPDFINNLVIKYTVERAGVSPQTLQFGPSSFTGITNLCPDWS